jgi:23S rRNA (guanosine2251-2'-O)-methyltransferase
MQKTIIYGFHAVETALRHDPGNVRQVWIDTHSKNGRLRKLTLLARKEVLPVHASDNDKLDELAKTSKHQGIAAEYYVDSKTQSSDSLFDLLENLREPPLLLILDSVTDPHNLGACLRTAEGAGVHAVIVPKDNAADITPTVRKVACGAAEVMPFIRVTNLVRTMEALKEAGVWITGTSDKAHSDLYTTDLTGAAALAMGAEGKGLRPLVEKTCDTLVSIPMAGKVSSLNVSVATGVCLYEIVRQRNH